jgi:hypothetical protein
LESSYNGAASRSRAPERGSGGSSHLFSVVPLLPVGPWGGGKAVPYVLHTRAALSVVEHHRKRGLIRFKRLCGQQV